MVAVIVQIATARARQARSRGETYNAVMHSRNALWYTVAILVLARQKETLWSVGTGWQKVRHGMLFSDFKRIAVNADGSRTWKVEFQVTKTVQNDASTMLFEGGVLDSGLHFEKQLALHADMLSWAGFGDVFGAHFPLFGDRNKPGTHLASADAIVDYIDKPCPAGYAWPMGGYSWQMAEFGYELGTVPHISGHSFRKGGANALRDALVAQGRSRGEIIEYLMKFGRWKSAESLAHYLAFTWQQLAAAGQSLASSVQQSACSITTRTYDIARNYAQRSQ